MYVRRAAGRCYRLCPGIRKAEQLASFRSTRGDLVGAAAYPGLRKASQLAYLRSTGGGPIAAGLSSIYVRRAAGAATCFGRAYAKLSSWLTFDLREMRR